MEIWSRYAGYTSGTVRDAEFYADECESKMSHEAEVGRLTRCSYDVVRRAEACTYSIREQTQRV